MRTNPYTATFVITPLISADTWLGAAGCASGSQTCSGTSPAFDPAPISASANAPAATAGPAVCRRMLSKARPPVAPPSRLNANSSVRPLNVAISR